MLLAEELIQDYKDLEKLQDQKNPFSPKKEEQCSYERYVAIINAKTQIANTLLSLGVCGVDEKTGAFIVYKPDGEDEINSSENTEKSE